uniref:THAP-type domain-containing protein n=1 Tax=Clastoptera arizonana TaxID=38151 RepID=A0A1B6DLM1_9HEMI
MGRYCVAPFCNNSTKNNIANLSFHRFPKDDDLRKRWVKSMNRDNSSQIHKYSFLCSNHFEPSCLIKWNNGITNLKHGSVPTIFSIESKTTEVITVNEAFTFVGIKVEESENQIDSSKETNSDKEVKEEFEGNSFEMYEDTNEGAETSDNFIIVNCEDEQHDINDQETDIDPLEEEVIKQEIKEEIHQMGLLTDLVITDDQQVKEIKQEDEVMIEDVDMDYSDEEIISICDSSQQCESESRIFKCKYCEKVFTDKQIWRKHLFDEHNDRNAVCNVCNEIFVSRQDLFKHTALVHKNTVLSNNMLTCEICLKKCKSVNNLRDHTLFHKVERRLQCTICETLTDWIGSLYLYNVYKNKEKKFVCQPCDHFAKWKLVAVPTIPIPNIIIASNNPNIIIYPTKQHENATVSKPDETSKSPVENSFTCEICKKNFNSNNALYNHQLKHKVSKALLCSSCGVINKWSGTMFHLSRFENGEIDYKCAKCELDKSMECSVCKRFVSRWCGILQTKPKSVEWDKIFICSSCNSNDLPPSTSKSISDSLTKFVPILPKHNVNSVNQKVNAGVPSSDYTCVLCGTMFSSIHKLYSHKEGHQIQSMIDCSKCKKMFKWFGTLAQLEDFVAGIKQINCIDCDKKSEVQFVFEKLICIDCQAKLKWVGTAVQLEKYSSGQEKIRCLKCQSAIETADRLGGELVELNINCDSCKCLFLFSGTYSQFQKITLKAIKQYCPICTNNSAFNVENASKRRKFSFAVKVCTICKKMVYKEDTNSQNVGNSKSQDFICDSCSGNKTVVDTIQLVGDGKIFSCDICRPMGSITFPHLTNFLSHIKCHAPIKDFVCTSCNTPGFWGKDKEIVDEFKCEKCNTDLAIIKFSKLTKDNVIFENKIVDHFVTTPLIDKDLECCSCKRLFPWSGNEKQLKEFTNKLKVFICLRCSQKME